jgi:hypothetical protein
LSSRFSNPCTLPTNSSSWTTADPHEATSRAVSGLVTPASATAARDQRRPCSEQVTLHLRQLSPAHAGIDLIQPGRS